MTSPSWLTLLRQRQSPNPSCITSATASGSSDSEVSPWPSAHWWLNCRRSLTSFPRPPVNGWSGCTGLIPRSVASTSSIRRPIRRPTGRAGVRDLRCPPLRRSRCGERTHVVRIDAGQRDQHPLQSPQRIEQRSGLPLPEVAEGHEVVSESLVVSLRHKEGDHTARKRELVVTYVPPLPFPPELLACPVRRPHLLKEGCDAKDRGLHQGFLIDHPIGERLFDCCRDKLIDCRDRPVPPPRVLMSVYHTGL